MWLGYCFVSVNLSLGILFVLIYISAIAVVLFTTLVLVGASVTPLQRGPLFSLLCLIVFLYSFFSFSTDSHSMSFIPFPYSYSSVGMSTIAFELLAVNAGNLIALTFYYFLVGCLLVNCYNKSLHHKTSSGMRGLTLNSNLELATFSNR